MMPSKTRRDFLKSLGIGIGAVALPINVLSEPTPESADFGTVNNGSWEGIAIEGKAGQYIPPGSICYIDHNGVAKLANCGTDGQVLLVASTGEVRWGDRSPFLTHGIIHGDGHWSPEAGKRSYLCEHDGWSSPAAPCRSGDVIRPIGYSLGNDSFLFNPSPVYMTIH